MAIAGKITTVAIYFEKCRDRNIHIELRGEISYIRARRPDDDGADTDARQRLSLGDADVV